MLQQVELLILIYHFFRQPITVQRLTTKAENSLSFHVPGLGDTAAGGIPFRNKDGALLLLFQRHLLILAGRLFIIMEPAVPKLLIMQVGFFGPFVRKLFY